MSRNLILWVIDSQHRAEQQISEASVRRHMPDTDVLCIEVKRSEHFPNWYENYILALLESLNKPYDKFLFLDSDTYLCEAIYDVFDILDKYDIVSTHAPARQTTDMPPNHGIPEGFVEFNTGVLGYRNGLIVKTLFQAWLRNYYFYLSWWGDNDQAPLRLTCWEQGARVWVLPEEYNLRWGFGCFVSGKAKVLHGRSKDIVRLEQEINAEGGMRTFTRGTLQ